MTSQAPQESRRTRHPAEPRRPAPFPPLAVVSPTSRRCGPRPPSCPPVLQEQFQDHGADDGRLVHDVVKWGQSLRVFAAALFSQRETGEPSVRVGRTSEGTGRLGLRERGVPWGMTRRGFFCTNSKDSRVWTTSLCGGQLSLKHMVDTRSTKKPMHRRRKWACFSMAALAMGRNHSQRRVGRAWVPSTRGAWDTDSISMFWGFWCVFFKIYFY